MKLMSWNTETTDGEKRLAALVVFEEDPATKAEEGRFGFVSASLAGFAPDVISERDAKQLVQAVLDAGDSALSTRHAFGGNGPCRVRRFGSHAELMSALSRAETSSKTYALMNLSRDAYGWWFGLLMLPNAASLIWKPLEWLVVATFPLAVWALIFSIKERRKAKEFAKAARL